MVTGPSISRDAAAATRCTPNRCNARAGTSGSSAATPNSTPSAGNGGVNPANASYKPVYDTGTARSASYGTHR